MKKETEKYEGFYPGCSGGDYDGLDALKWLESVLPHPVSLIPLRKAEKRPAVKAWTDIRVVDRKDLAFRALFTEQTGIGLLCGEPSSGLCMIDIDKDEFVDHMEVVLPVLVTAPKIHGARGCKWLVKCIGSQSGFALFDASRNRIGEFLGERQQGVVAGIHPVTAKPYRWDRLPPVPTLDILPLIKYFSRNHPNNYDQCLQER